MVLSFPREPIVEWFLGGRWRDVSADIRQSPALVVSHGTKDEAAKAAPARCTFELDDGSDHGDGDYNPLNPMGQWFGKLGRNTPTRYNLAYGEDTFTRTSGSGWDTSEDEMGAWSSFQSAGTVAHDISANQGRHQITSTTAFIADYLDDVNIKTVDFYAEHHFDSAIVVAGGNLEPANLMIRGQSTTTYYMLRVQITTAQMIQVALMVGSSDVLVAATDVQTFWGTTDPMSIRFQADGNTFRGKVWKTSEGEPLAWNIEYSHGDVYGAGWVGIRSGVAAGNSNSKPINNLYDNLKVRIPRFAGEVSKLVPLTEVDHKNERTQVEASGVSRRMRQGNAKLESPFRRWVQAGPYTNVEYYPLDDDVTSNSPGTSLISGRQVDIQLSPIVQSGGVKWGENPKRLSLDKVVTIGADSAIEFPVGGSYNVDFAFTWTHKLPVKSRFAMVMRLTAGDLIYVLFNCDTATTGYEAGRMMVQYVNVSGSATTILDHIPTNWTNDDNQWYDCGISVERNVIGGTADFGILFAGRTVDYRTVTLGSSFVPGQPDRLMYNVPGVYLDGVDIIDTRDNTVSIGHLATWDADFDNTLDGSNLATWIYTTLRGYEGETAGERHARVLAEQSLPYGNVGYLTVSPQMGGQSRQTTANIVDSCAAVELSVPTFDARGSSAVVLRTNRSMANQTPILTLDYSNEQVAVPFRPITDDQRVVNGFTAKRTSGGEYRYVKSTGPLNNQDPGTDDDAVGLYDDGDTYNVYQDSQLSDIAGFRVNAGTIDVPRFSTLTVNTSAPDITAALAVQVLDVGIGDMITVANMDAARIYDDIRLIVRGYTETLDNQHRHRITFNTTPADVFDVFVLDSSTYGRLDSGSSTLNEALTTTETGADVVYGSTGDEWSNSAAPYDVIIAGERCTVTGVAGSTLTLTRSVNAVVKEQVTGAKVSLFRPYRLALA